jgi:transcriptional regulator with XRE-family HTH domain
MVGDDQTASKRRAEEDALWKHIGRCLQVRRTQLGLTEQAVAEYVGIPIARYRAFEAGGAETPAAMLAQIADLFEVSIFYFFQALPLSSEEEEALSAGAAPVLVVATDEDRSAALLEDFHAMDRGKQQYVLLLARTLAKASGDH